MVWTGAVSDAAIVTRFGSALYRAQTAVRWDKQEEIAQESAAKCLFRWIFGVFFEENLFVFAEESLEDSCRMHFAVLFSLIKAITDFNETFFAFFSSYQQKTKLQCMHNDCFDAERR